MVKIYIYIGEKIFRAVHWKSNWQGISIYRSPQGCGNKLKDRGDIDKNQQPNALYRR